MSRLRSRIAGQHRQAAAAAGSGHPPVTAAPSTTPTHELLVHVRYDPGGMTVSQGSYAPDGRILALPQGIGRIAMSGRP